MKAAVLDRHVLAVLQVEKNLEKLKKSSELLELIQKTETPKEVKDDERIQREVSKNIRPPSTRRFHNVDKIITVRLGSKPEHHQRNVLLLLKILKTETNLLLVELQN
ncbi:uncharacterized protein LOC143243410 isoform X1 [Tachypleus tridentatus]|uniref:uncharacterized protein LOC143242666 n=1 Tax=Tachypleus tridentatus TaxID=6853 RepID=UPI003FCFA953